MKNVKVIIKEDGSVIIEYNGFQGSECFLEAQRLYEKLKSAGVQVSIQQTQVKPEFYSKSASSVRRVQ